MSMRMIEAVARRLGLLILGGVLIFGPVPARAEESQPSAMTKETPAAEDECVVEPVYGGINALPPVTSQIYPTEPGNTVVNDMTCLPGKGPVVVVGSWPHAKGYTPKPGENPCEGEPAMKIAYPLDYGAEKCYCWKHWVSKTNLHPNSAKSFTCGADHVSFSFIQWTDLVCGRSGTAIDPKGEKKTLWTKKCCRDSPPEIWSQILNYSGCAVK